MPTEDAKMIVEGEGEIVSSFDEIFTFDESNIDEITPFAISTSKLKFSGDVVKVNSTLSGYKAFYAYADFRWLSHPVNNLTDKISVGLPSDLGVYFKTSNGSVVDFYSSTSLYNSSTGGSTLLSSSTKPSKFVVGGGVVSAHDLRVTVNASQNNAGRISQVFYIKNSKGSGKANIAFNYGHQRGTGSVGVSVGGGGFGISLTPTIRTDVREYINSFNY